MSRAVPEGTARLWHEHRDPGVHYVSCWRPRRPASRHAGPRRHASRGVLLVEGPILAHGARDGEDGCFSAAPPLADQESVTSL
jgi:hypothetical protein